MERVNVATGLVIYYSRSGNTKKMAQIIAKSMNDAELPTVVKDVADVSMGDIMEADAIVIGSPCYYGEMASEIKSLIDESVSKHSKLDGKIGAAFSSSANVGGGNETVIMGILHTLLVHGMIIQGDPQGDHFGPVSIGSPDERATTQCQRRGKRIAELTKKIHAFLS